MNLLFLSIKEVLSLNNSQIFCFNFLKYKKKPFTGNKKFEFYLNDSLYFILFSKILFLWALESQTIARGTTFFPAIDVAPAFFLTSPKITAPKTVKKQPIVLNMVISSW